MYTHQRVHIHVQRGPTVCYELCTEHGHDDCNDGVVAAASEYRIYNVCQARSKHIMIINCLNPH